MIKFDEATHTYTLDGKKLISVTQLMQKHGLAPRYDNVDPSILQAKAERGTLIHKEIEDYNKRGEIGFTTEQAKYIEYIKRNKIEVLESELLLHNDIVAGTCDLVLGDATKFYIADIKTTYTLHKEAVSWQLSIYAYLYWNNIDKKYEEIAVKDYKFTIGQAYHFDKDGNLNVVDIPLKPYKEVARLINCERNGEAFEQNLDVPLTELMELSEIEKVIAAFEKQKKEAEAKAQEMRQALLEAMQKSGTTQWTTPFIQVTYVAPSIRTTIDKAKLEKELPDIAAKYTKKTDVKASLKITLKEAKK